ncbi:MAG TPA: C69 family dipeptidase [Syntrophomonadaceae bacterium]|nr:C69 family dipeptidase [Syntrophomonadaceae bacterium]HQA06789.1 C69 family dipeptidase [Syntrophomonadaceae bacterium]HQE22870.1 C69 family dipeptidase [Syntrophomonadaceae bacterium]
MCDTMVAMREVSRDGQVYFAKNSDRQPNEPHIIVQVPRRQYPKGARVRCTYIEIEQSPETYAVLLLKPSWIWGCEMGSNEFGLNIGNEAVFTREKYQPTGLTGMDLIRLALERCRTSQEAMELIIGLLQRYGQGGNCGYEKPFTYHNSFLITDPREAWVLETAGKYWAAEKVKGIRAISNGLTIGSQYDRAHPDLIKHAREKGWCKTEEDFNFARCYKDKLFTYFSGSGQRCSCSQQELEAQQGKIDTAVMMQILRSHHPAVQGRQFQQASLQSVCMHGGGIIGDHTTGSYVACLSEKASLYWVTGASTPCLAMFKPLWLVENNPVVFREDQQQEATGYWQQREIFHRMVINGQVTNLESYYEKRDQLEESWREIAGKLEAESASDSTKIEFMSEAWRQEAEVIRKVISENQHQPVRRRGNPYFRSYWRRQTARLGSVH